MGLGDVAQLQRAEAALSRMQQKLDMLSKEKEVKASSVVTLMDGLKAQAKGPWVEWLDGPSGSTTRPEGKMQADKKMKANEEMPESKKVENKEVVAKKQQEAEKKEVPFWARLAVGLKDGYEAALEAQRKKNADEAAFKALLQEKPALSSSSTYLQMELICSSDLR